ncbi:hypothetical protein DAPPUDRAFT_107003 [Daphnia pulex]|uniref:Uncharacterized protein n=1 Tax=Daphnia pulex TaxID=6669 RepID=E9GVM7_DAPPU|nr:hypothetical protein DAPPUDRAFT_107003 [Daphnia pulex]|eukprot:EFX76503.1 hypothetical protein DAPPUDRAFT_107003 [Daphnia pulex]
MAGSTTSVPMSSWYGGYQTATPPPYYPKATYATTSYCTEVFKYYTTKAPDLNNTTYAAPSHYTDALKYYSAPSYYTTKAKEDDYACCPILRASYTEAPKYYSVLIYLLHLFPKYYSVPSCYTEAPADYYTEAAKYYSAPIYTTITEVAKYYAVPTYCTEAALSYYVEQEYYTDAPVHYTTTYATPQPPNTTPKKPPTTTCYTEAPADVFTKTVEYYTEAAKYFSAPIYTTTTEAAKYYAVPTCYTKASLSCYVEQLYYTDVPIYYTTTYATPSYNTAAPKYYTEEAAYYTTTAISYGKDENTNSNTKIFKSGIQMERLSYNSTATSGLHCNRMQHTMFQSVFITPFTIWLQQDGMRRAPKNRQRDTRGTPFRKCTGTSKSALNDLANWFLRA